MLGSLIKRGGIRGIRPISSSAPTKVAAEAASLNSREIEPAVASPVVNSFNEWDPLEEVIVGRVEGATIPEWHISGKAVWPPKHWDMFKNQSGESFPLELIQKAQQELDYLAHVLEGEGVIVRRPEIRENEFKKEIKTPDFTSQGGLYAAMPRDILLVVGNEIIEAPMAWRSRFFEYRPYRKLIKEYFQNGARWTAAPKPQMSDELYVDEWDGNATNISGSPGAFQSVLTEFEPAFDAAEFSRFGRDIFTQESQVTNRFGIEWLGRHLGSEYDIHVLDFKDRNAMHIDGTFVPLMPGKILANPLRPCVTGSPMKTYKFKGESVEYCLPEMFKGWEVFLAPTPLLPSSHPLYFTSPWTATCNVLILGPGRVIVEAHETDAQQAFKDWGFEVIPVPFRHFLPFGGSFHCATCDIRRTGSLESYFN